MNALSSLVAVAAALGLTLAAPVTVANAKESPRPTVRIPSSFNIPWWDCEEDAWTWVSVKDGKRIRVRDYDVTIRKPGYTEPIGDDICGYMGSGTYNFRVKVYTQKRGFKWKKRAVYKTVTWQEIDHYDYGDYVTQMRPFQCQWYKGGILYDSKVPDMWQMAYYICNIAGEWWEIYDDGSHPRRIDYTVNRETATSITWSEPQAVVFSAEPGLTTGEPITGEIRVVTGREATPIYVTKTERKFNHWKRYKVRAWKNAGSFVVTGKVRVNVS